MKSCKNILSLITVGLLLQLNIQAVDSVITFFIKEKKVENKEYQNPNTRLISDSLVQPSFINAVGTDRSWLDQPGVDGISAVYLGYMAISNKNGQITFPRRQQSDTMYILVTPEIKPEYAINVTLINQWLTKKRQPAAFYQINRKKNHDVNTYYFEVKKLNVPHDIPLETITIFASPADIYVPVGISLNTYSTNLILPELQAQKMNIIKNSLYTLPIKQYFEQINIETKNNTPTIANMVVNL